MALGHHASCRRRRAGGELGGPSLPAYLSALLQQTADNLDRLQQLMGRSESERSALHGGLVQLNHNLAALERPARARAGDAGAHGRQPAGAGPAARRSRRVGGGLDSLTRDHIRNTDIQLGRLVEEVTRGRHELSRELRGEIKLVARTIAIVAGEPQAVGE